MKKKKYTFGGRSVPHRTSEDTAGHTGWQPSEVARIVANPIYAGFGPIPAMIPKSEWVAAAAMLIKELGPERFLHLLLENLSDTFKDVTNFGGVVHPPSGFKVRG